MMTDDPKTNGKTFLAVPVSTDEFVRQKPAELSVQAKAFQRDYWADVRPYIAAIGGESASITGHPRGDEWKMTFEMQTLAAERYPQLSALMPEEFRQVMRRAYKGNTKVPIGALMHQGIRLRIEHLKEMKEAAAEEEAASAAPAEEAAPAAE